MAHQIQAGTMPCSPESSTSLGQHQPDPSPGSCLPVLCSSSRAELSPGRGFVPANSQQIPPAGSQGSQGHLPSSTAPKFRHLVSPAHLWAAHLESPALLGEGTSIRADGICCHREMPGISYLPLSLVQPPQPVTVLKEKCKVFCPCLSLWDWDAANIFRVQMEKTITQHLSCQGHPHTRGEDFPVPVWGQSPLPGIKQKNQEETASNCTRGGSD